MKDLDIQWDALLVRLTDQFDLDLDLKGVLYLIGVQELNKGIKKFTKEEKVAVLHVAVCKLLSVYGFYEFERVDEDGWPHWKELKVLKSLSEKEQEILMKKAILNYLN